MFELTKWSMSLSWGAVALALLACLSLGGCKEAQETSDIVQQVNNENNSLRGQVIALGRENALLRGQLLNGESWEKMVQLQRIGGTGGNAAYVRLCPKGQAVAGFYGRSGSLIDAVWPTCRPVDQAHLEGLSDVVAVETELDPAGGAGGKGFDRLCGQKQHAVGMRGRHGQYIDSFQVLCQDTAGILGVTPVPSVDDAAAEPTDEEPPVAASKGEPVPVKAGTDEKAPITAPLQRDADVLKGVERRDLSKPEKRLQGSARSEPVALPVIGGTRGSAFERRCPKGWALVGISGRRSRFLDSVKLHCGELAAH